MNEHDDSQFSEKEVSLILKRAAELQRLSKNSAENSRDLSLQELLKIASEAGLDTRLIRQAAGEIVQKRVQQSASFKDKFLGSPTEITLTKKLPFTVSMESVESLLPVIQQITKEHGYAGKIGKTFTWQSKGTLTGESCQVIITTRKEHTEIQVQSRTGQVAGGLFGGIMGGMGGGLGIGLGMAIGVEILGSFLFPLFFPLGTVGVAYLLARGIYRLITKQHRKILDKLIIQITEALEAEEK